MSCLTAFMKFWCKLSFNFQFHKYTVKLSPLCTSIDVSDLMLGAHTGYLPLWEMCKVYTLDPMNQFIIERPLSPSIHYTVIGSFQGNFWLVSTVWYVVDLADQVGHLVVLILVLVVIGRFWVPGTYQDALITGFDTLSQEILVSPVVLSLGTPHWVPFLLQDYYHA